jgi:hypothetical protein
LFLFTFTAVAAPIYTGGNGAIVFGVADYGLPVNPGAPTYIPNNFTGLVDILTSPGGGYLTADTSIPNNISEIGPAGLPASGIQVGGGNANGAFGRGAVLVTGPLVGFALQDINPNATGAAAYEIASWNATFLEPAGYEGLLGSWLSVFGRFSGPLSAGAVSLRTTINSNNPNSPFFGGLELTQLVLAASQNLNNVAIGGAGAVILNNGVTFRGLAVNRFFVEIPQGDIFTATSTLTVIADPMDFISIVPDLELLDMVGPLPDFSVVGTTQLPEPAALHFAAAGLLAVFTARQLLQAAKGS